MLPYAIRPLPVAVIAMICSAGCVTNANKPLSCSPPRFQSMDLLVGDGKLDSGYVAGLSFADVDNDGDPDLMVTRGYGPQKEGVPPQYDQSMLYINLGNKKFARQADSPMSNSDDPASGSTWADIDGDGDLDAFVSTQHNHLDRFYRNSGSGRMVREELGDATKTPGSNFSSVWADFDADGDLDLVSGGPTLDLPQPSLVYRNDDGRFVRVISSPLENGSSNPGAILWADVDNDGDQDAFFTNSDIIRMNKLAPAAFESSQLLLNDREGRYSRTTGQDFAGGDFPANGAAFGDIDNDGDLDLYLQLEPGGDLPDGLKRSMHDRLFLNDGAGHFTIDASFTGPEHDDVTGGVVLADLDQDGDLDVVATNFNRPIALYLNNGRGQLEPVDDPVLSKIVLPHTSLVAADIDGDGDIDLAAGTWSEGMPHPVLLLINESPSCGQPIRIHLHDRNGSVDPIGARVTVRSKGTSGERLQTRETMGQTSFRSQSSDQLYLGVPSDEKVIAVEVRWPSGETQVLRNPGVQGPIDIRQR